MVVSHDRAFLDRCCDDIIAFEPGAAPARVPGGLAAWIKARAGARRAGSARLRDSRPAASPAPVGSSGVDSAARKSASTLRHRLRSIEKQMAPLTAEKSTLELQLVSSDHRKREAAASRLAEVTVALAGLEESWLEVATELG